MRSFPDFGWLLLSFLYSAALSHFLKKTQTLVLSIKTNIVNPQKTHLLHIFSFISPFKAVTSFRWMLITPGDNHDISR